MIDLVLKYLDGRPIETRDENGLPMICIPPRPVPSVSRLLREWLVQEGYQKLGEANTVRHAHPGDHPAKDGLEPTNEDVH